MYSGSYNKRARDGGPDPPSPPPALNNGSQPYSPSPPGMTPTPPGSAGPAGGPPPAATFASETKMRGYYLLAWDVCNCLKDEAASASAMSWKSTDCCLLDGCGSSAFRWGDQLCRFGRVMPGGGIENFHRCSFAHGADLRVGL